MSHDLATTTALSDTLWLLGPERDAAGQCIAGATISKKHQYNLAEMGLAWQPGIQAKPEFVQLIEHLKDEIRQELNQKPFSRAQSPASGCDEPAGLDRGRAIAL